MSSIRPADFRTVRRSFARFLPAYLVLIFTQALVWVAGEYAATHAQARVLPPLILSVGLLVSLVLFGAIWSVINARLTVERDLRASLMRDRLIELATNDAIWDWDIATNAFKWNQAVQAMFRYAERTIEPTRQWWLDKVHPDDRERVLAGVRNLFDTAGDFWADEYRFRRGDGSYATVIDRGYLVRDAAGAPARMIGALLDVTDRKQSEARLLAEKERLAVTLWSIGDGVITTDANDRITLMNPVAEALTGWTQADALGQLRATVVQLVAPENGGTNAGALGETRLRARDGTERLIAATAAPIGGGLGQAAGTVQVLRDVTRKQKALEDQLRADKLESLGLLSGGLAHDFNNILTAILGNLTLAKLYASAPEKVAQKISDAEKAARRARDLTQQLMTFAKGGAPIKKPLRLAAMLQDATRFALSGSTVAPEFHLADDLWPVEVDEGQFSSVIGSLAQHSVLTQPESGTVRVSAANFAVDAASGLGLAAGAYVKISFADRGAGVPAEHLSRLFDPYFVSKLSGRSLGLAAAHSIVRKHGGLVTVASEAGQGTTFDIYLPRSTKEVPPAVAPLVQAGRCDGRVLLMDDEESVRLVGVATLTHLGYEVTTAADGTEALALYERAKNLGRPFDLLIMDLTVPGGLGGVETLQRLKVADPQVRAIVSSGYSNDPVMANFEAYGFVGMVVKPYEMAEMERVLYRVIGPPKNFPVS